MYVVKCGNYSCVEQSGALNHTLATHTGLVFTIGTYINFNMMRCMLSGRRIKTDIDKLIICEQAMNLLREEPPYMTSTRDMDILTPLCRIQRDRPSVLARCQTDI